MACEIDARGKIDVFHHMLGLALIEIRAAESLDVASRIADVFHNVPMALINCSSSEDYDRKLDELIQRSRRAGLESYLRTLQSVAERSVVNSRVDG